MIKEGTRLRKNLGPLAPMHEKRDVEALRTVACQVMELVQGLPMDGMHSAENLTTIVDSLIAGF